MKALLVIDVQNDFCPGGALAVPDGNEVVKVINKIRDKYDFVIFTFDSHPKSHCSFKENGGIWPAHCVMETNGHNIHKDLIVKENDLCIQKGMNSKFDSYSGFKDERGEETILVDFIEDFNINEVDICGLSSEYCVSFTAQDAISYNLKTKIITDACRCINEESKAQVFKDLATIGIGFTTSDKV